MMVALFHLRFLCCGRIPVLLMRRCVAFVVVGAAISATVSHAQSAEAKTGAAADFRANPKFVETMTEAKKYERQKHANFAADDYKKANKMAAGQCFECLAGLYRTQMMEASYKDAIATSAELQAIGTTPAAKSLGAFYRGSALLMKGGDKPKPAQLEEAHAALQEAISLYPKNVAALFTDGKVEAMLGKTEDARNDFKQCLSCVSPTDPARLRAEHFAEDPELATHKMAPPFEVTALDGTKFSLDAMGGRVVLIDFWATWCGPCNQELPHMRKIAKEFAGEPFVMISVSWDADEQKWKDFLAKNDMTWEQYRDADHSLSNEFGINAIPHYFTIDSDGVLTAEMLGEGSDVEGKLKKLIKKAREAKVAADAREVSAGAVPAGN
jgi:thiol-disulfide isomerase/thioredoxin/Flp pilus assembly protein TadD